MKNLERLDQIVLITNQIKNYWRLNPNLRFGQLLDNLTTQLRLEAAKEGIATDIFYIEDDKMEELLEKVLNK